MPEFVRVFSSLINSGSHCIVSVNVTWEFDFNAPAVDFVPPTSSVDDTDIVSLTTVALPASSSSAVEEFTSSYVEETTSFVPETTVSIETRES